MKVVCRTNLDVKDEEWPTELPILPPIGSKIQSATTWVNGFRLQLKVVDITLKYEGDDYVADEKWYAEIELHIAQNHMSIKEFFTWYAGCIGKSVSAFI